MSRRRFQSGLVEEETVNLQRQRGEGEKPRSPPLGQGSMGNICPRLWEYLKPCLPCFVREAGKPVAPEVTPENTESPCPPEAPRPQGCYFVALFDYQARTAEDLSFHAGDKLQVLDTSPEGWWFARHLETRAAGSGQRLEGYIPSNYVAEDRSLQAEP